MAQLVGCWFNSCVGWWAVAPATKTENGNCTWS